MSSSETIRSQMLAVLNSVDGVGNMYAREKYHKTAKELKNFYVTDDVLCGGFIRRKGLSKRTPDTWTFIVKTYWEIELFKGFSEADDSELEFDTLIDSIGTAFVENQTLNNTVDSITTEEQAGIRLVSSQPAMFAGVLVHYAKLSLITEHTE
ncbi:MAG: hypothetical protein R3332_08325 [Pseudohongiellaceae bacterium]|nr:hypothetical protein [Pseudohongiellaceae bacterium]